MSPIFSLLDDFIQKMSNPVYGMGENEDYAIKFGQLISNSEVIQTLEAEAKNLSSVDELSPYSWLWLLRWCRSRKIMLDANLLLELMKQWESIAVQALIIQVAISESGETPFEANSIENFPNEWLRKLLIMSIEVSAGRIEKIYKQETLINISFAQTLLFSLIQTDRQIARHAARTLLRHEWLGRQQLLESYRAQLSLLEADTRTLWIQQFGQG
ncbi:MAG: hypothetical protein ACJ75B_13025 [Flavisolibacter sp.]